MMMRERKKNAYTTPYIYLHSNLSRPLLFTSDYFQSLFMVQIFYRIYSDGWWEYNVLAHNRLWHRQKTKCNTEEKKTEKNDPWITIEHKAFLLWYILCYIPSWSAKRQEKFSLIDIAILCTSLYEWNCFRRYIFFTKI